MMNCSSVKKLYECMPKKIKFLLSPIFIRVIINNPIYQKTIHELDEFEKLSYTEKKEKQLLILRETLIYAYNNVPYYKEKFDEVRFNPVKMNDITDIAKIPLLTKDMAIEAGESIYSTEKINYYESVTGGVVAEH